MLRSGIALFLVLAACGGEKSNAPLTTPVQPNLPAPAPVATITVSPSAPNISASQTVQLTATLKDQAGNSLTGREVTWSSATASVATVSNTGLVTGVAPGNAVITATSEGKTGSAAITVSSAAFPITWTETFDGRIATGTPIPALTALKSLPDGSVIGVGANGTIAQRSSTGSWSLLASPVTSNLSSIGVGGSEVWVAGQNGVILRRSGNSWVQESTPSTQAITRLTMRSDGTGYAVTATALLQRSGGVWSTFALPATPAGFALWSAAVAGPSLFVLGYINNGFDPLMLYWSNGNWITVPGAPTNRINGALAEFSDTEVFLGTAGGSAGGMVYRISSSGWTMEFAGGKVNNVPNGFARCPDGSFIAVQAEDRSVIRRQGGTWAQLPDGKEGPDGIAPFGVLACPQTSGYVFATTLATSNGSVLGTVGADGTIHYDQFLINLGRLAMGSSTVAIATAGNSRFGLRYNGSAWIPFAIPWSGTNWSNGPAVAVFPDGSALLAGSSLTGTLSGTTWTWTRLGVALPATTAWGTSITNAWMAGSLASGSPVTAIFYFWNGSTWAAVPGVTGAIVAGHGVGSSAMFVGSSSSGSLFVRTTANGAVVETVSGSGTMADVIVLSPTSAIAVGALNGVGRGLRWDGSTWTAFTVPSEPLVAITGRSAQELYGFTATGKLWGYNGTDWVMIKQFSNPVRAARMAGNVGIAVGDGGMVIYGKP